MIYVFRFEYTIIRKGDKGKILERKRTERIGCTTEDGGSGIRSIKRRFGNNTRIDNQVFIEKYDPILEAVRLNAVTE